MSKSEILYVKAMNMSESDDEDNESAWEDRKLIDAYDKAINIYGTDVAQRLAMSTNTVGVHQEKSSKNKKKTPKPKSTKKKEIQWKSGMPCRSVYEGDGLEYEAFVLRIINDKECVIRYLGYENSEIVPISLLKPTHGNDERTRQIEQALLEKGDDGFGSQSPLTAEMETSDRVPSPDSIYRTSIPKNKRPSKKKSKRNSFELPEIPMTMPNISMLRNLGSTDMPMPPPPMAFSGDRADSEDQAISSMLLSWYMSGYYTGLYQGLKRAKESRRNI